MDDIITIEFDGFGLNAAPYSVSDYDPSGSPNKATKTFDIARQHGSVRVFEKYDARSIVINGRIICDSRTELETAIDNLKRQLRRQEGTLKIGYGDSFRYYVCTAVNVGIKRLRENISFAPYTLEFECESPFSTDGVTDTLLDAENVTDSTDSFGFTSNGTFDIAPTFQININSIDPDDSEVDLVLGNPATSQQLTISDTFATGDIISVDCLNQRVFKNGLLIYATGQFPEWAVGSGILEYSDTADDRDIDISMYAERRYL